MASCMRCAEPCGAGRGGELCDACFVAGMPIQGQDLLRLAEALIGRSAISRKGHVLVIDDDGLNLTLIERRLAVEGYTCELVSLGADGLARFAHFSYDAVLLDLRLPDRDGLELLARMRRLKPSLPVIVMTAHGSEAIAVRALTAGANNYLIKPFPREALAEALARALCGDRQSSAVGPT